MRRRGYACKFAKHWLASRVIYIPVGGRLRVDGSCFDADLMPGRWRFWRRRGRRLLPSMAPAEPAARPRRGLCQYSRFSRVSAF